MTKPQLWEFPRPLIGADPELFIAGAKGKVIGSELAVPKEGIPLPASWSSTTTPRIVRDGVQVELHPQPAGCRQRFFAGLMGIIKVLDKELLKKGVNASFKPVVRISKKELDKLSDESKVLGCAPSLNTHRPMATVRVPKSQERVRAAGGHIHLGAHQTVLPLLAKGEDGKPKHPEKVQKLVNLLDVLVGLPCVLIDRDPAQKIRRRVYGRAGEYRLPAHGIEYRTPSNFWLRHYLLGHFVTGMCRLAYSIWGVSEAGADPPMFNFADDLLKLVNMKKVERAINRNDFDKALEQFLPVLDWIEDHVPANAHIGGLHAGSKENFLFFVNEIKEKGIKRWFPQEPMDFWRQDGIYIYQPLNGNPQTFYGSESWLAGYVAKERVKAEAKKVTPTEPFPTPKSVAA